MKPLLFIVATHGDEASSVEVLHKIEKNLPKNKFNYDVIIANEKAYQANKRFLNFDLNRIAPGDINSRDYEQKRAAQIVNISKNYHLAIDIHGSTSPCGVVSIITLPTIKNIALATMLDIPRHVIWYSKKSLKYGPLSQFLHCPSIEIEHGPMNDQCILDNLYEVVYNFIKKINQKTYHFFDKKTPEFYSVYEKLEGSHDFSYIDFQKVSLKGEEFYPFLSNQYPNIICYKMKKESISDYFLY